MVKGTKVLGGRMIRNGWSRKGLFEEEHLIEDVQVEKEPVRGK